MKCNCLSTLPIDRLGWRAKYERIEETKEGNDGSDSCRYDSADTILVEDENAETNGCYIIKML